MIRLFIENNEADVTEGFSHQITYAIDDLNNLDSKATSFSKTIVLPGTSKNNYLLGNIFEFSNSNFTGDGPNVFYNFNASKSAKCRLEINGLQIIKGVLRLLEIIRDGDSIEYEVAIFGELGGFVSKLSNKKLEDLDFAAYNHEYSLTNITDYWDEVGFYKYKTDIDTTLVNGATYYAYVFGVDLTYWLSIGGLINFYDLSNDIDLGYYTVLSFSYDKIKTVIYVDTPFYPGPTSSASYLITIKDKKGFGVYYPLIDYGNFSTDKANYSYKTFRPALFVREYIHKIITEAGYTYESRFFESDFFSRLIIPHNQKFLLTTKSDLFSGTVYGTSDLIINGSAITLDGIFSINKIYGEYFTTSDLMTYTYIGTSTTFICNSTIQIIVAAINGAPSSGTVQIRKNGVAQSTFNVSGVGSYFVTVNFNNATFAINNNDTIDIYYSVTRSATGFPSSFSLQAFSGNINIISQYPILAPIALNEQVEVNKVIPQNILQKDFFTSLLKMFYLMVTEDKYKEKHLKIEPWTWFFNLNSSTYLDWTMKLDRSQPIRIKPMSEASARYYELKYKSETDYFNDFYKKKYNEGYGDTKYDNQLEFAKESQTSEVIFAATPLVGYDGEDKVVSTIMKWDGKVAGTNEETVNSIIRIMQAKRINGVTEWSINGDEGVLGSYTQYPYAGHFNDPDVPSSDLNFGATKELFYSLSAGALGNNLFNTFYSSYLAEITDKDSRLVTAKFKLNDTDVFNLDFSKFIYLDGVLYRLSRVVDYTPGEICTVELLRVIYTTYDNTVNAADEPEVLINGKIWKAKNFNGDFYRNGDLIPQITDDTEWQSATYGAWCYYENNSENGVEYGKLYNWYAVNDARGLAPVGYHVATKDEWADLVSYITSTYDARETGTDHWENSSGTDLYGFKALGGGYRRNTGPFLSLLKDARFWTATQYDETYANYAKISFNSSSWTTDTISKGYGYSVRLIKD